MSSPFATLSPGERRVLMRLTTGRTNRQMALDLRTSVDSVRGRLRVIYRKIGARNRTQAAAMAWAGVAAGYRAEVVDADETFDKGSAG